MTYRLIRTAILVRLIGVAEATHGAKETVEAARRVTNGDVPQNDEAQRAALRMEHDASGFASRLGSLFLASDGDNRQRLLGAFPDVFATFGDAQMAKHRTRV